MQYSIFEGNLERLEKKLKRIHKKCQKYEAEFRYEIVGEEYKEVEFEDETTTTRFVIVDVEGFAKINGWEFVATINHHEKRNVVRNIIDIDIPDRYWTSDPYCEHCSTNRRRNSTYLVHNVETGEFKQVGRSCLRDYTGGYDAELAAAYISLHESLIESEHVDSSSSYFGFFNKYHDLDNVLKMSKAVVSKLGFISTSAEFGRPSKYSVMDLEDVLRRGATKGTRYLVDEGVVNYFENFDDGTYIEELKKYYLDAEETSSYINNMKTIFSSPWCESKNYGYIVSAVYVYDREIEKRHKREIEERRRSQENAASNYIGEIKDKITVNIEYGRCISSYENQFGYSYLYKFVDENGNCLMWSSSKAIDEERVAKLTGTVKKHEEYNGLKQTWVTRCKVEYNDKMAC